MSLSGVTAIAAGEYYSLALLSNGEVYAWGRNNYAIEVLARDAGFSIVRHDRLGSGLDVLSTVAADLSILPDADGRWPRVKTRIARGTRAALLAALGSRALWRGLKVNSNLFLSNGVVLGPR